MRRRRITEKNYSRYKKAENENKENMLGKFLSIYLLFGATAKNGMTSLCQNEKEV